MSGVLVYLGQPKLIPPLILVVMINMIFHRTLLKRHSNKALG